MQCLNEKMHNVKEEHAFLSYKIIWMEYMSGIWHVLHGYLCFKKLYQTCVKTSPSLLMRSVVHKKTAYMLPVQVLRELSSKMSAVQTAALVPVPPAQGKSFPVCLGMPVACFQLPASQSMHQGLHLRAWTLICLMGIFSLISM